MPRTLLSPCSYSQFFFTLKQLHSTNRIPQVKAQHASNPQAPEVQPSTLKMLKLKPNAPRSALLVQTSHQISLLRHLPREHLKFSGSTRYTFLNLLCLHAPLPLRKTARRHPFKNFLKSWGENLLWLLECAAAGTPIFEVGSSWIN